MKSLILAIALNEEKTIFKEHFGDAPFFHLYRLNESEITEQGTHDELVSLSGIYADLHYKQLLEEELKEMN